jgi:hypothetical protein
MYDNQKKIQLSAERRQREDEAPRLADDVPSLFALQIAIVEQFATGTAKHRKHIIVSRAPALFLISCGDERCAEGGHDITYPVMHALRTHQLSSEGGNACCGSTGSAPCGRTIHYEMSAQYTRTN